MDTEQPIFPRCWVFDINRRTYEKDSKGQSCGSPIWREHWREEKITGETKVSWVTQHGKKIPKKRSRGVCFSSVELDQVVWAQENRYKLSEELRECDDFAKLQAVSKILRGE